jgi:hypothetical protein
VNRAITATARAVHGAGKDLFYTFALCQPAHVLEPGHHPLFRPGILGYQAQIAREAVEAANSNPVFRLLHDFPSPV